MLPGLEPAKLIFDNHLWDVATGACAYERLGVAPNLSVAGFLMREDPQPDACTRFT
jgi:hypothetical protein